MNEMWWFCQITSLHGGFFTEKSIIKSPKSHFKNWQIGLKFFPKQLVAIWFQTLQPTFQELRVRRWFRANTPINLSSADKKHIEATSKQAGLLTDVTT